MKSLTERLIQHVGQCEKRIGTHGRVDGAWVCDRCAYRVEWMVAAMPNDVGVSAARRERDAWRSVVATGIRSHLEGHRS